MKNNRTKTKIVCIKVPVFAENETKIPFIGLALITSALKEKGYSVWQTDFNAISRREAHYYEWLKPDLDTLWSFKRVIKYLNAAIDQEIEAACCRLLKKINLERIDFVLLSVGLYDNKSSMLALCLGKYIKQRFSSVKIIIGGERYPNYEPIYQVLNKIARTCCFDYYIRNFGEAPLLYLFNALECSESINMTPGIYYVNSDKKIIGSLPRESRKVRLPDFEGLIDEWHTWKPSARVTKMLIGHKEISAKVLPVNLIYGCPNRCAFCRSSLQDKRLLSHIDPSYLAEGINYLKEKFNTRYFFFAEDIFNISPKFVTDICNELISKKVDILWSDCAQFRGWTKDLLFKARESGAIRLIYGMETASSRLQEFINKNVNLKHAENVLRWSHEAGIFNGLEIIAGLPTETDEDIRETINFIERNREYIDEVTLNAFYLLRGSLMYVNPSAYGIENIRQIVTPESEKEKRYHQLHTLDFDEIDGLKWPEKRKQISDSAQAIRECLLRNNLHLGNQDRLHVLFELYDCWKNKAEVRKRYRVWKSIYGHKSIFGLPIFRKYIKKILLKTNTLELVRSVKQMIYGFKGK